MTFPYIDGYEAYKRGEPRECPEMYQGKDREAWYRGYDAAKATVEHAK